MRALASERCGPSARGVEVASDERMKVPVSRAPTLSCLRAVVSRGTAPTTQASERGVSRMTADERMKVTVSRAPTLSCLRAVVSRGTAPTTQGSERCAPSRRASDELLNVSASRAPTLSAGRRS